MRHFASVIGLLCLFSVPAHAHDARVDWSGPYVAVGVLANSARVSGSGNGLRLPGAQGSGASLILGHDWQDGPLVLGAELALSRGNLRGQGRCGAQGARCSLNDTHYLSLRLRAGVAQGRGMGFVTLGLAHNRWEHRIGGQARAQRRNGVVLGIGAEYALRPRLSLRVDAEHMRLAPGRRVDGARARYRANTLRLSLVRRF